MREYPLEAGRIDSECQVKTSGRNLYDATITAAVRVIRWSVNFVEAGCPATET